MWVKLEEKWASLRSIKCNLNVKHNSKASISDINHSFISVKHAGFAQLSRLANAFNHVHLLLEEEDEEVALGECWVSQVVSEGLLVLVARHEGRRADVHEALGELSVALLNYLTENIEVLVKVGRDELQLLVALEEALHLDLTQLQRVFRLHVGNGSPEASLLILIGQTLVTQQLHLLALVTVIIGKH